MLCILENVWILIILLFFAICYKVVATYRVHFSVICLSIRLSVINLVRTTSQKLLLCFQPNFTGMFSMKSSCAKTLAFSSSLIVVRVMAFIFRRKTSYFILHLLFIIEENQLCFECNFLRGSIDPRDPPRYEPVIVRGSSRHTNSLGKF